MRVIYIRDPFVHYVDDVRQQYLGQPHDSLDTRTSHVRVSPWQAAEIMKSAVRAKDFLDMAETRIANGMRRTRECEREGRAKGLRAGGRGSDREVDLWLGEDVLTGLPRVP